MTEYEKELKAVKDELEGITDIVGLRCCKFFLKSLKTELLKRETGKRG